MDPLKLFPDDYVPNEQSSNNHKKWVQANPNESQKWAAYRDKVLAYKADDPVPVAPTLATPHGKALVAAGKLHVSVTDIGAVYNPPLPPDPEPPPQPTGNPYFIPDYSSGLVGSPFVTLFYNGSGSGAGIGNGFVDLTQSGPISGTPDGRVSIVNDPAGSGQKVIRFEIRDTDPVWPIDNSVQKSEARTSGMATWNKSTVSAGDVRWFGLRMYMPYTATEKFEVAQNSNDWNVYCDIHSTGNTISPVSLGPWGSLTNQKMYFRVDGGTYNVSGTPNYEEVNCFDLLNSSGGIVAANYNRWLNLVFGIRFAPDSTGWMEVWVDGVNVYPRKQRPTMWTSDQGTGMYFKHGIYNSVAANYPVSGRTVLYHKPARIGLVKADVDSN